MKIPQSLLNSLVGRSSVDAKKIVLKNQLKPMIVDEDAIMFAVAIPDTVILEVNTETDIVVDVALGDPYQCNPDVKCSYDKETIKKSISAYQSGDALSTEDLVNKLN